MSSFIVNVARLRSAVVVLIVSVSLVALISTTTKVDNSRNHIVVHGFHAPPIRQARTTTTTGRHYNSFITTTAKIEPQQQSNYNSGCRQDRIGSSTTTTSSIATTRSSTRLKSAATAAAVVVPSVSLSFLSLIPSALWWILGHNILANAGLPFVVNGSKVGGWYSKIDLPSWIPNKKLFGPVWTFLYTLMGIAVSRIFSSTTATAASSIMTKNNILLFWAFHYSINITWASIFFGLQRFRLGLIVNYVLVATLGMIVPLFYTIDKISALLLLPYTIWLLFATYLNVAICKLNPTDKDGYNDGMFHAQLQKLQENAAKYAFGV